MALFNAIVEKKLKEILSKVESLSEDDIIEERAVIENIVNSITEVIETKGLPTLKLKEIVNPVDTYVDSEYLDQLQKQMYRNFTYYDDIINDIGSRLNTLVDKVAARIEENNKLTQIQRQEIENLRNMAINKLNTTSILGELLIRHETLKDDNIYKRDCEITNKGAITLPLSGSLNLYDANLVKNISFRVISPRDAERELSFIGNISGKPDETIIKKGYFQGRLYGLLNKPNDIRLHSDINNIIDGQDDTVWECEYTTNNPISSSFTVSISIQFTRSVLFNFVSIGSSNEIEVSYLDADSIKRVIDDYDNDSFELVSVNNITLLMTQNYYESIMYNLMAIDRSGYILHTYNIMETYYKQMREEYLSRFPTVKIEPIKEIEQQATENNTIIRTMQGIYRYAVSISDITLRNNTYKYKGTYETSDIDVGDDIYAIELESKSYVPNASADWIKYSVSFDSGKTWARVRPKTESLTSYNNTLKTKIQLGEGTDNSSTLFINTRSQKVRMKIEMLTNDELLTPVVFWYKMRVKLKGGING